jgi:hypothetical protein
MKTVTNPTASGTCLYSLFSAVALSLLMSACVSEFNANLPDPESNVLVVEGTIIGNSLSNFQLSKSIPLNDESTSPMPFDGHAKLTITGSDGSQSQSATYLGSGKYEIPVGALKEDVLYGLKIEYDGDSYLSAPATPLTTPEIDSVSWKQPEKEGDVSFYVSTHSDDSKPQYFLWNYEEDWEITAYYYVNIFYNPSNDKFYTRGEDSLYYCWKKARVNELLIGNTETFTENRIVSRLLYQVSPSGDRFSNLYGFNVKQQAIDKAAYEYYLNRLKTNEEMGGLFTPQPSDLDGNISCTTNPAKKVIGYVSVVKNITQKRVFVNRSNVSRPRSYSACDNTEFPNDFAEWSNAQRYTRGYRPLTEAMGPPDTGSPSSAGPVPESWATSVCVDCKLNGGAKSRPAFWPNNHQ